jgi:undecaprenyl diphosphate synthase
MTAPLTQLHWIRNMHVAISIDGNGQWATQHGLPPTASRAAGISALRKTVALAADSGVSTLTLYAMCTPDCERPRQEIDADVSVLRGYLRSRARGSIEPPVRISVIGGSHWRDAVLPAAFDHEASSSVSESRLHLRIVVDYSAHDSVMRTVWRSAPPDPVESLNRQLSEIDPTVLRAGAVDLLVRTGSGRRPSDFMLWEVAYARLYSVNCLWPDFTVHDFRRALDDHARYFDCLA